MHQTVVVLIIILPVSIVNHHTSCISTSCDDVMPCASLIKTKIVGCLDYSYLCYIFGVRSGILSSKMTQLEVPLPEITVEDFSRAWTRFGLVAVAKGWDDAKQLAVLPALLRGKLLDYYLDLGDDDKATLQALKAALKKKAGIDKDPLKASKLFNERCQGPQEKPVDFASELKKLFKQAFPDEDTKSAVLLQRFLIGLKPQISTQILLRKKPETFQQAIADAVEVEEALSYNISRVEEKPSPNPVNAVSTGSTTPHTMQHPPSMKLQDTLDTISKRLEQLETKVQEGKPRSERGGGYRRGQPRWTRQPSRRQCCYLCGEEGHFKRECPLNYTRPAGGVGSWPGNR